MEDKVIDTQIEQQAVINPEEKRLNIEVEKDGKKFIFSVPDGTSVGTAYDACYNVLQAILGFAQKITENAKPQEPKENLGDNNVESGNPPVS